MKFSSDDILYYVCPFVFTIEKVKIDMVVQEDDGSLYYIDHSGANLNEIDLFNNLKDAQINALEKLEKFTYECKYGILNNIPKFNEDY